MRIISRYVLAEFFKALCFTSMVFVGLYVIAKLVDDMRTFVTHHPSFTLIFLYYMYVLPFIFVQVLPLAVLLSVLFSLGQLGRHNELSAMRSCGISFHRIALPILSAALMLVGVVLVFNEIVIPYTNPRAHHIMRVNIKQKSDEFFRFHRDWVTRRLSGNRILHTRYLDALSGQMQDVILLQLGSGGFITQRVDAPSAYWKDKHWIFENGTLRYFDEQGQVVHYDNFATYALPFREAPGDFIRQQKEEDQILATPMKELYQQIRLLREMGSDPRLEEVNLHLKIAFPFANFVLALLGVAIPFLFPTGQRAIVWTAIGFVITVVIGFFYIGFIAVGTSFGKNGTLSPVVSVWIANCLFGLLGAFMISKVRS
ncbi:LptF/LptG family permease [candidate division FCPU426 bacterium]|nr:LptF/LptG family permease [candidate division FCPU426 bacterium]